MSDFGLPEPEPDDLPDPSEPPDVRAGSPYRDGSLYDEVDLDGGVLFDDEYGSELFEGATVEHESGDDVPALRPGDRDVSLPSEIELPVPGAEEDDANEAALQVPEGSLDGATSEFGPLPDLAHGLLDEGLLGHIAHELGVTVDADDLVAVLQAAVIADGDLAVGLDPRSSVRLLGDLGVDAAVGHGTVESLADFLREGRAVVLGMADGDGYVHVVAVDEEHAQVVLGSEGRSWRVGLDEFAQEWAVAANELVLADGLAGETGLAAVTLGAPGIVVLPIAPPGSS